MRLKLLETLMAEKSEESRITVKTALWQTIFLGMGILLPLFAAWSSVHDKQVIGNERQEQMAKTLQDTATTLKTIADSTNALTLANSTTHQTLLQHQKELDNINQKMIEDRKHCDDMFAKNLEAFNIMIQQLKK